VLPLRIFNNEPDIRLFDAGQVIFEEDSPGDFLYALLDGEVEIIRHGKVLETVHPGGVFGEMALIDQQPRTASAVAKTPIRVAAITEKRFNLLVSQNPPFALAMMRLLAERVRHNLAS
jgi:CRP-like cAMP-binding protein